MTARRSAGSAPEGPLEADAHRAEETAGKPDGLVEPAGQPQNAVLADNARVIRWAGPAFTLFC